MNSAPRRSRSGPSGGRRSSGCGSRCGASSSPRARKGIKPSYPYRHAGNDLLLAHAVADLIVKEVRKYIADLKEPPNALATIRKKGFDDPLVWTGKLSNAVKSEIG